MTEKYRPVRWPKAASRSPNEFPLTMNPNRHLTRQEFLRAVTGGVALGLVIDALGKVANGYDTTFKIFMDGDNEHLTFNEAEQLSVRLDRVYDSLPEYKPRMSREDLLKWILEVVPMFEYEGIVGRAIYPEKAEFIIYEGGDRHNHTAGQSDCEEVIVVNSRMVNDHSSWYGAPDFPLVVIHELAHIQQTKYICDTADRSLVENSAQIGAVEVAAALANSGNLELFQSLVYELRGIAINAAYAVAMNEEKLGKFAALRDRLSPGALSAAKFARSRRHWEDSPSELKIILDRYSLTPMNMIVNAIRENGNEIKGLAFPERHFRSAGAFWQYSENVIPIELDDTAYFFEHLEHMAADVATKLKKQK